MMARATCLIAGVGGTTSDGGVYFPSKLSIMADAFAPSQVLNFGTLAYVADCYNELHLLHGATLAGIEPPTSPPPPGPLRANLEVLAQQIWRSLGLDLTVSDCHRMFYILANVHHQVTTGEALSPPNHF